MYIDVSTLHKGDDKDDDDNNNNNNNNNNKCSACSCTPSPFARPLLVLHIITPSKLCHNSDISERQEPHGHI